MSGGRLLAIIASVVVAATLVAAVVVMDTPGQQRERRMDERRVQDLQRITSAAQLFHRTHRRLPGNLAAVAGQPGLKLATSDPESGEAYEYQPTGERSFRVCARFATDTAVDDQAYGVAVDHWNHGVGRHCFNREAGKDDR